ncbi:MAG: neutral/alkaline non-lysosomal ceramidase N-terminal domain-containing protein [Anaerolineae bacterium]|nr:neutral/alkaline non-lysosomal ceramidase N-terminal domain-containing protein [Anaerolineae bacterium]
MNFGIARDLITPDVRTHPGGYATLRSKYLQGIHDDLYVKTVLLDDGNTQVVLISLDLLFHDGTLADQIAAYVGSKYSIPRDCIFLSYTHTHAGPAVAGYDPTQVSDQYEAFLLRRVASCVDRAFLNTFPGQLSFGSVAGNWNVNRRLNVNGVFAMRPNYVGVRDTALNILKITDANHRVRGILLNYGCHPVTLRDQLYISAEYPGRLCQLLDSAFYGSTAVFFQGAGADARPLVTASGDAFKQCNFDEVDDMALAMANNVQKAVAFGPMTPVTLSLAARQFAISLPIIPYSKAYLEETIAQGNEPADDEATRNARGFYANAARIVLETYDQNEDMIRLRAGIVRLNDRLYIAYMGGEPCYPVKESAARAFGDATMLFFGYGDATGYIVDDKILSEGGYEAEAGLEYCWKGRLKPGIDEKIYAAYRDNLHHFGQ